ncbi:MULTISPECIES: TetR/AcrR family transcriptional regulator [Stappiaceae]|jgi:AcrR family transcriptional regulator|uniref:TetR/AcrR family transcriptional regulator n=1 Tax=Stappiaceae TaxID=2821832 RepID=UPI001063D4BD|nr:MULTISPECIES: TetR/AcrR family transcriptional regulator [Stappiaceae]MBO9421337.1 TetR/AcrR family transcriptional regulator [Labrenzia sp. R4_2]MBO9426201.1 TetR/AcrR family transcriptional regulator [Labrenzia sp. R4_1]
MSDSKDDIAAGLEQVFWSRGFAEPSVPVLRAGVGVSMRTLYRYFPSREAMILGALEFRHQRYMRYVTDGVEEPGLSAAEQLFDKLGGWMRMTEGKECFFRQALAANPDSTDIAETVNRHKSELLTFFGNLSGQMQFASTLYLLHEGVTASYAELGEQAVEDAKRLVRQMFKSANESKYS